MSTFLFQISPPPKILIYVVFVKNEFKNGAKGEILFSGRMGPGWNVEEGSYPETIARTRLHDVTSLDGSNTGKEQKSPAPDHPGE